jgi:hypothetical protein
MSFWSFRPYVPVAKRREQAKREIEKLKKKGRLVSPIVLDGRKIVQSFGARPGAKIWSVIPTTQADCRGDEAMFATALSSICKSHAGACAPW